MKSSAGTRQVACTGTAARGLLALIFAMSMAGAQAQAPSAAAASEFKPQVGQPGKDVVWVPTSQVLVDRMLDMAKVTPADFVIDLGSGDGRTVITAAKRGIGALGIEYNPDMVTLSTANAAKEGVSDRAKFVKADIFETDFSQATVITMFLLPDINVKLRPRILSLKPGTRIVSNSFTMGDWEDDQTATVDAKDGCSYWCVAHMWIVPARVEGTWQFDSGKLTLKQTYQMVSGTLESGGQNIVIAAGRLLGDQFTFRAGGSEYVAKVSGGTIEGSVKVGGQSRTWSATRTGS